jgi:hypothetical protein
MGITTPSTPVRIVDGEVQISSDIPAGEEIVIGKTVAPTTNVTANPVLTVAGAYIAGDYVGTSAAAIEFEDAVRASGGSATIKSVVVIDKALQSIAGELWLFDAAVTPPADNAPWSITDLDAAHLIGIIPISTYYASALNSVAQEHSTLIQFTASGTSIFGCFVTRGTPTYASLDLIFKLGIWQD